MSALTEHEQTRSAIARRLTDNGFNVHDGAVAGTQIPIAVRQQFHWTLTRIHIYVFLFAADEIDYEQVRSVTDACRRYAVDHKTGLRPGLQTGVASLPVFVVTSADADAVAWVESGSRGTHFGTLEFPVMIASRADQAAVYKRKQSFWGGAFHPLLRRIVERCILPALALGSHPRNDSARS